MGLRYYGVGIAKGWVQLRQCRLKPTVKKEQCPRVVKNRFGEDKKILLKSVVFSGGKVIDTITEGDFRSKFKVAVKEGKIEEVPTAMVARFRRGML